MLGQGISIWRPSLHNLGGGSSNGIALSASTFTAAAAQNTAIGTLSVVGGTGTYTFTLTDSHTNAVQVAGTNGVDLQVGSASSSAGSFSITVHADNGAGSTFDKVFLITATGATTEGPMGLLLSLVDGSAVGVGGSLTDIDGFTLTDIDGQLLN